MPSLETNFIVYAIGPEEQAAVFEDEGETGYLYLSRVSTALRMAASTLRMSKTYLGAQFRRLKSRLDTPVAIKAMAAKLARLVYRMLRYGMKYVDRGAEFYEAQHRQLQIKHLKSKAAKLGFQIIQVPAA
jgi:transposase